MKRLWLGVALGALLAGCAHVDYVGESYAPTTQVDVYYSEANVPRAYTVIGEILATGDMLVSTGKMQDQIRKEAQKHGADAVVLTGMDRYQAGESTSWNESETESKDKKGRTKKSTSGSTSTSVEEKKQIRADRKSVV